jgi:hypothetical protein
MSEADSRETINHEPCLGEQLFNEIKDSFGNDRERAKACVAVLKNLPENLVEQSYAHLRSESINETHYSQSHPDHHSNFFSDKKCIEGYVNEILANIQIKKSQPELRGSNDPETRKKLDEYEKKILSVANDPARYHLDWHVGRNPDVAWLELDDQGRVIIKGIGEITTSRQLNKRKYLQLGESGFAANLRNVARKLNNLKDGDERGLSEFGEGKKQVEVAPQLKRYLMVHHDLDTSPEGLENSLGESVSNEEFNHLSEVDKKKVFSESEKHSFIDILNSSNTVIIKSVFNNCEINLITAYIFEKIQVKYPSYQPKNF